MAKKEIIAMLLAGGKGSRLGVLTKNLAKPAVPFGGEYRLIDFPLSNCSNSGIETVGVLTQYKPLVLNSYVGVGRSWDLDRNHGGITVLPPHTGENKREWYKGTADAVYQNMKFINIYDPEYVLILSGDHIYKMDYSLMLDFHKDNKADATIAVIEVPWEETFRFGIMNTDNTGRITEFQEKPAEAESNLASMGVYIFNWKVLKTVFLKGTGSHIDFGKNVIPDLLETEKKVFAYPFKDYWKDVGTIDSYWEAHMDLLDNTNLDLFDRRWPIYSVNPNKPPQYVASTARIDHSLINKGTTIAGTVVNSVLFYDVQIGKDTEISDSVVMPGVHIKENVRIEKAIISSGVTIESGSYIGAKIEPGQQRITVIGENCVINSNTVIENGDTVIGEFPEGDE